MKYDPLPSRTALKRALEAATFAKDNAGTLSPDNLAEIVEGAQWALQAIPESTDFTEFCLQNPINQVFFRAGLLACREYMARFVEQGGDKTTAASIRANWWPRLGDDPGPPRLFDFAELADEHEGPDGKVSWTAKEISPSAEALPRAYLFLLPEPDTALPSTDYGAPERAADGNSYRYHATGLPAGGDKTPESSR